jgi:hypothetical protein
LAVSLQARERGGDPYIHYSPILLHAGKELSKDIKEGRFEPAWAEYQKNEMHHGVPKYYKMNGYLTLRIP